MFQENGWVNENLEPFVTLKLTNGTKIDCLIDTGFYGTLFLPRSFVEENNFPIGVREFLQAAESQLFEVDTAIGEISWLGEEFSIRIYVTDTDDALLGAEMLIDTILEIDYLNSTVKITKT